MRLLIWYKKMLMIVLALLPLLGIGFLQVVADSKLKYDFKMTHEILILVAIALSAALGYAAYLSYKKMLAPSLRYIALGYFGFSLIYSFHGFFTPLSTHHMLLFVVYGPVSRLIMCVYVYVGLRHLIRHTSSDPAPVPKAWWWKHVLFFALLSVLCGWLAESGALTVTRVKLVESVSLGLSLLGVTHLILLRKRSALLRYHLTAQLFFAQTSLAFIISSPWNGLWWFAHAISAAAFMVLGFAIVRSYEQTESVGGVYEETLLYPVLRSILQTSHEGIMMTDPQGRIIFSNQQTRHFFPGEEPEGHDIRSYVESLRMKSGSLGHPHRMVEELLKGDVEHIDIHVEISGFRPHSGAPAGSSIASELSYYEFYAAPVMDEQSGDRLGYLFVFRNRSEEERLNQMKNDFIGIVSHELRTPLSSILGFSEIILTREVAADKRTRYVQTIHNEANRLANLINDFLDIQRIESGRQQYDFQPVDLSVQLQAVTEQWQGKEDHTIRCTLPGELVAALADAERIIQILHNLISNAVKYSPNAEFVDVSLLAEGEEAVIRIRDYGLGIPEESLPQLFKKFYRVERTEHRRIRGTGLGLTICKEIVEAHGGSVEVVSELGAGTTFTVRLPLYHPPALEGKLAVLEDDEGMDKLIREAIGARYGELVRFTSAEEALFALEHSAGLPWLWIVDIRLEGQLDGWALIRRLKAHLLYRSTSLVVSTVSSRPAGYKSAANETYLRKPYKVSDLLEHLEKLRPQQGLGELLVPSYDEPSFLELLRHQGLEIEEVKRTGEISRIILKPDGAGE